MIHTYKIQDDFMLVDVNSGAVHQIDEIAFEILGATQSKEELVKCFEDNKQSLFDRFGQNDVEETYSELMELIEEDMLFAEDTFEAMLRKQTKKPLLKALCLHICHDCNLRCKYCFAGTGDFGGKRTMMSTEVGIKAIDMLLKNSGTRRNLEVDFFGGEPLMNFDVVKAIVKYARSKEAEYNKVFRFTITTNAVLLNDDNMNYINSNMDNVVLSIDGRKEVNDNMRKTIDGRGSYEVIMPKIKKMVELRGGKRYYVRGTFTRNNLDFSKDVLSLADEGFKEISVEPVVSQPDSGLDLREQDLPELYKQYELLADEMLKRDQEGKGFNFFHFMIDMNQGPCIAKRTSGCGAGYEYVAVTPTGEVFPCHQFVGIDEFQLGTVDEFILDNPISNKFAGSNLYSKEECRSCWAKFYCSGGCAANSWQFNNRIDSVYKVGCDLERKRVECSLWKKAKE